MELKKPKLLDLFCGAGKLYFQFTDTGQKFTYSVALVMASFGRQFQVTRGVIFFIAISVMYFFMQFKAPSEHLSHYQSMLKYTASFISHRNKRTVKWQHYLDITCACLVSSTLPVWVMLSHIIAFLRRNLAGTGSAMLSLRLAVLEHNPLLFSTVRASTPNMPVMVFKPNFSSSFSITNVHHGLIISHSEVVVNG